MPNRRKIGIIGHFGGNENILDGQTIKTKILYNELIETTNWRINTVDTYLKHKKPIKLLFQSLKCLLTNKNVIVLLSGNGMKFYFPLFYFFSLHLNSKIYHDVIGGNLHQYVINNHKYIKYLNSFQINWVETASMKTKLEEIGISNCEVLPNFKRLNIIDSKFFRSTTNIPYKFCTFSRVMKEKGIEEAIEAIQEINRNRNKEICILDIYGRIDEDYKDRFEDILKISTQAIKYCGMVPFDKSVEAIKDYDALLFPTSWDGEGFPGTIVDAFSAGLPVIATDWNSNGEIIENKIDGILYPNNEVKNLKDAIEWSIQNIDTITEMKINCINKAHNYQPEEHIKKIIDKLNQKTINE